MLYLLYTTIQILILLKRSVVELTEKLESEMLLATRHGPKGGVSIVGGSVLPSSRLAEVVAVVALVMDLM